MTTSQPTGAPEMPNNAKAKIDTTKRRWPDDYIHATADSRGWRWEDETGALSETSYPSHEAAFAALIQYSDHINKGGPAPVPHAADPAPDPIEAARERTAAFVKAISTNTLLDLRRRRDELDNLMARISHSGVALEHYIGEFAKFNHEALVGSTDIGKCIADITTPFKADPPATITQLKEPPRSDQ